MDDTEREYFIDLAEEDKLRFAREMKLALDRAKTKSEARLKIFNPLTYDPLGPTTPEIEAFNERMNRYSPDGEASRERQRQMDANNRY